MGSKPVLIIAEAGVNHNGDLDLAKRLVDTAAEVGADFVKFQTFTADRLVTKAAVKAEYQTRATDVVESQYAMLRRLQLSLPMHEALLERCRERGIRFLSSGFDTHGIDVLVELGLDRFKIPSGELTNLPYLHHVGRLGKPVILSTGMATLGEIEAALGVLEGAGTARDRIIVLHCTTEYPTRIEDVNLRAMVTIQRAFGVDVGYSDHTAGIEVAVAAVALGACVIEKHLTLDRELAGPDHSTSLLPREFAAMVRSIRNLELAMGDGIKRPSASEAMNKAIVRKSIVAAEFIRSGELLTERNLTVKRPGTGISPMRWHEVIGRRARRDFAPDELIDI